MPLFNKSTVAAAAKAAETCPPISRRSEMDARSAALATEDCGEAEAMEVAATTAASGESIAPLVETEASVRAEVSCEWDSASVIA